LRTKLLLREAVINAQMVIGKKLIFKKNSLSFEALAIYLYISGGINQ
jgi:hypothetical protein